MSIDLPMEIYLTLGVVGALCLLPSLPFACSGRFDMLFVFRANSLAMLGFSANRKRACALDSNGIVPMRDHCYVHFRDQCYGLAF